MSSIISVFYLTFIIYINKREGEREREKERVRKRER